MVNNIINVFVDESGDLGFNERSSDYFIIGFLVANYPERIKHDIRRLLKSLNMKRRQKITEFKFSTDRDETRHKMLNLITKHDIDAGSIIIRKAAVKAHLRDNKSMLYNFLVADHIVQAILSSYENATHVNLHLDVSMSKNSRQEFSNYFSNKMQWSRSDRKINQSISNSVSHDYSHQEPCIQAADYLAGSLYQLFEHNDSRYFDMIKHKVVHSYGLGVDT